MKKNILILILFLWVGIVHAQLQTAHWYFGGRAGVDFNSGTPVADTNGQMTTLEGCTTISDEHGNLLFYSNGVTVYDRNHQVMPNGTDLLGHDSSTQSAIAMPIPDNCHLYYLFTIGIFGGDGLSYSIIDTTLNNGYGDVAASQKNIPVLLDGVQAGHEKITAVINADRTGYWVITHYNGEFYAFSVTGDGVDSNAVVSATALNPPGFFTAGYLKASPDGSKLAIANYSIYNTEYGALAAYDFDTVTGVVSNETVLYNSMGNPNVRSFYGVEFSPSGRLLYATGVIGVGSNQFVYQYDLNASPIQNSQYLVRQDTRSSATGGVLQLGLDGNIYRAAGSFDNHLEKIENPDIPYNAETGEAPTYVPNAVPLSRFTRFGLPQFLNYKVPLFDLKKEYCLHEEPELLPSISTNGIPGSWEPAAIDTSVPGVYTFVFTSEDPLYPCAPSSEVELEIIVHPLPELEVTTPEPICGGDTVTLAVITAEGNTVYWYESEISETVLFTGNNFTTEELSESTTYWVEVVSEEDCISERMEIEVTVIPIPELQTVQPEEICAGETVTLSVVTNGETINWYETDTSEIVIYSGNGYVTEELFITTTFWVEAVTGECRSERLPVAVTVIPIPELETIQPDEICDGETIILTVVTTGETVNWYDTEEAEISVHIGNPYEIEGLTETTSYWVEAVNEQGCISERQEIVVTVNPLPELTIEDTELEICYGETAVLTAESPGNTIRWYDDAEIPVSTENTFTTEELFATTSFWVEAISEEGCVSERQEILVTVNPLPELTVETPDSVCIGNTTTLYVTSEGNTINWYLSADATEPVETGNSYATDELIETTSFWVEAVSEEECKSGRIEIQVIVNQEIESQFTQIAPVCEGTEFTLPTESENGITGTWSPEPDYTQTETYTFTPDAGFCATTYEMTITVNQEIIPEFTQIEPVCEGTELTLPTESENGITGTWSPEFDNTQSATYTFTPDEGFCATTQTITIEITPKIIPEFTPIDPVCAGTEFTLPTESLNGITGTWYPVVNNTETTTYTFTPDAGFCATTQEMNVTVNPMPNVLLEDTVYWCDSLNDGKEFVDLWQNNIILSNNPEVTLTFYRDEDEQFPIDNPAHFLIESSPGVVYVSAAAGDCKVQVRLTILLTDAPAVSDTELEICSPNGLGIYQLTDANENIIAGSFNYTITYHLSYEEAKDGINPLDENYENVSVNQIIFARLEEGENCFNIAEVLLTYNETFVHLSEPLEKCDENSDGLALFNLTEKEPGISAIFGESGYNFFYYTSLENAYNNVGEIPNPESYENIANPQTVYAKVLDDDICLGIASFDLIAVQLTEIEIPDLITLCPGGEETVSVQPGFASYTWTSPNGIVISTTSSAILDTEGIYTLEITFTDNICVFREEIEVVFDNSPVVTNIEVNGATIIITAIGTAPLEYSMNGGQTWLSSNIFYDVPYGDYEVKVRSANGCLSGSYPIVVFEIMNVITPNSDGYNDTWEIPVLVNYPGATLKVFDKYGKILVNTNLENGFFWDGKYNGNPLPSTTYWYVLDLGNGQKMTGNITVKNY